MPVITEADEKEIDKPVPCTRCGECCKALPCSVARNSYWIDEKHWKENGCPMYHECDGVACCRLLDDPPTGAGVVKYYIDELEIGQGCKNLNLRKVK